MLALLGYLLLLALPLLLLLRLQLAQPLDFQVDFVRTGVGGLLAALGNFEDPG